MNEIKQAETEDKQLQIVQNLSATLAVLTSKPKAIKRDHQYVLSTL